jgi:ElaB/YqjD/DUF883 family membrane-anchored ribosome-binding protein
MSDAEPPVNGGEPAKAGKTARQVADEVKARADGVRDEARSFAAEAEAAREKLIAVAIHRARARRAMAQHWAKHQAAVAGQAVQTRPLTAIAAALGVGVIIGLLAAR